MLNGLSDLGETRWRPRYDWTRKYRKDWEADFPFIREAPDKSGDAYCTYCERNLRCKRSVILAHGSRKAHQKAVRQFEALHDDAPSFTCDTVTREMTTDEDSMPVEARVYCPKLDRPVDDLLIIPRHITSLDILLTTFCREFSADRTTVRSIVHIHPNGTEAVIDQDYDYRQIKEGNVIKFMIEYD